MAHFIEQIILIAPVISICFGMFITLIKLYKRIRQRFPIKVNCWFCNSNIKVTYNNYNSWICPHCEQYNGFDENGDYNCDIPAQRVVHLNKRWKSGFFENSCEFKKFTPPSRNGLCESCNRNQEIKVQQLATFEPDCHDNYDEEIEQFRKRLEKSYQLCSSCQRILKRALNRVTNNVLGSKLAQIGAKGLSVFDSHMLKTARRIPSRENYILIQFCSIVLVIYSIWNLFQVLENIKFTKVEMDAYFPPFIIHIIFLGMSYISAVKLLLIENLSKLNIFPLNNEWIMYINDKLALVKPDDTNIMYDTNTIIDFTVLLLTTLLLWINHRRRNCTISVLLLCSINMLWPQTSGLINNYIADLGKVIIATLTVFTTVINIVPCDETTCKVRSADNSFHKIYSNCDDDLSDNDDVDLSTSIRTTSTPNGINNSSLFNQSVNSAKSWSSSSFISAATPSLKKSLCFSTNTLNQSIRSEFNSQQQPKENLFQQQTSNDQLYFFPHKSNDISKKCTSMSALNSPYCLNDDWQNRLNSLNISGKNYLSNRTITCSSPTPSLASVKRRSQLLTPSRLNLDNQVSVAQTSWVAGGFFGKNTMSPQKRQQSQNDNVQPILSRTSSQSSGFESQTSSAKHGNGNGSRESSLGGDGDYASMYSEPINFSDSVSQIGLSHNLNSSNQFGKSPTLRKPEPIFPILSNTQSTIIGSSSCFNESNMNYSSIPVTNRMKNPEKQQIYHQFGTQHGINNFPNNYNFHHRSSMDSLNKLNNFSPAIRKGSLLKTLHVNCTLDN